MDFKYLEACRINKVNKLVFASSSSVYGDTKKKLKKNKIGSLSHLVLQGK